MSFLRVKRALCVILCLCLLASLPAIPVFAEEGAPSSVANVTASMQFPSVVETIWGIDFTAISSLPSSVTSETYGTATLSASNSTLAGGNGLTNADGKSSIAFRMTEPQNSSVYGNSVVDAFDGGCLVITAVVNFESLPTVSSASYTHPLSLLKWERKYTTDSGATKTDYGRFVCLDEQGRIYNDDRELVDTDIRIPTGRDVTLGVVLDDRGDSCLYNVYVDGIFVFSDSMESYDTVTSATLCVFDTQRKYSAALKSYSLAIADPYYELNSLMKSDWEAIQTTKVSGGVYDLRLISLLDTLNYAAAGYEVIAAYREVQGGEIKTKRIDMSSAEVYTELRQNTDGVSSVWYASENGGKYISALSIDDIDATLDDLELCVRPYTERADGLRIYGRSQYLVREGTDDQGYPKFSMTDAPSEGIRSTASEDAYIRFGSYASSNFGTESELAIKYNNGYSHANSRISFIKFDISVFEDDGEEFLLEMYFKSGPVGATFELVSIDPDSWEETTLTADDTTDGVGCRSDEGWSAVFTYSATSRVDVSEAIRQAKANGETEVSFRLELPAYFESYASMYSREYGDGSLAASIVTGRSLFHYETNLEQYENVGYEPWGYAEMLVDDWWDNIQAIYARDYGTSTVVSDSDRAADYNAAIRVTGGSTPPADNKWSTVGTMNVRTVSTVNGYTALATAPTYDDHGGLAADNGKYYTDAYADKVNGTAGYFGTYYDEQNDRWWFITPEGNRYIALGMCTVTNGSTTAQKALAQAAYGDKDWATWTAELLNRYGLNTTSGSASISGVDAGYLISTHSGVSLLGSYGSELGVNSSIGGSTKFSNGNTMNVFDPDFIAYANRRAQRNIGTSATSSTRLGWTSDNELPADTDMLDRYLSIDPSDSLNAFSYATAWTWLRAVTGKSNPSIEDAEGSMTVNMGGTEKEVSYRELFRGFVYYRYYAIASTAIKAAAPNQLYLGCRELGNNYQCEAVMRVAGYFCDVVTLNLYLGGDPDSTVVSNIHKWACKPAYITEFYAKSAGMDDDGNAVGTQAYGIWEVTYPADETLTASSYGVTEEGAAYYVDSSYVMHVYYLANGKTTYVDAAGDTQTVPEIILTNNRGAGKVVQSQEARGQYYQTFALKMLESGYCVGWSWYRYQDNDVSLYTDGEGNITLYNQWEKDVSGLTKIHKGEDTDQSNLDSNKGIVSNDMTVYTEFAEAIGEISRNIYGLAEYFDTTRRN